MPVEEIVVRDLRIAFARAGSGPPLLLLHGAVCDHRVWRSTAERLSAQFSVVAWDAPGCGNSSDAPASFSMAEYADCLADFVDALGLAPAHVVGHSWGGSLALELCLRHAGHVRRLVLVGAYAGWAGSLPPEDVTRRLAFAHAAADDVESGGWNPRSMPGLFSDAMPDGHADELRTIMAEIRAPATRTMAEALAASDQSARLAEIAVPTLIVCGEADARSPLHVADALQRAIPGAQLAVLPGLGHECYLEDTDAFVATVRPFLR